MNTTTTEILLKWIAPCEYFVLQSKDGDLTMQEIDENKKPMKLFSCLGVLMKFLGRSKDSPQRYRITIEHLECFK